MEGPQECLGRMIDGWLNGDKTGAERPVAFMLVALPFEGHQRETVLLTNIDDGGRLGELMRELSDRFEGIDHA